MKITLVQDVLRSGGTERQTILLANAFAAAGHAVSLVTFRPGGRLAATVAPAVARRILQPLDLHLDWFAPGLVAAVAASAPAAVLCLGRMANCYAGHLQRALPHTAVVATMRTGKPLPLLFRRSLALVRHIVANSRDARATLVRTYNVPTAKISVIPNALVFPPPRPPAPPVPSFSPPVPVSHSARLTESPAFPLSRSTASPVSSVTPVPSPPPLPPRAPTTRVLLCVAMFRPEKNQRELIEIAAGLPPDLDWQLWLAGDGPTRPACEALAAARGLSARVQFPGFFRDPAPLYAAADVAVHASRSEALSNFLIEAQAHGLPAIAYAAQGIDETFLPDRTGWVIPRDDRSAFRTRLLDVLARPPAARAALAAEASAFARTTFDPARNVAAYLDLFASLS